MPPGYSSQATDCAPEDGTRWQLLTYVGADRDGDGATVAETSSLCTGAVLPEPIRAVLKGNDCDDADVLRWRWVVLYPDADGVGAPPRTVQCLGASSPSGVSTQGWDIDDANPALTADLDEDVLLDLLF